MLRARRLLWLLGTRNFSQKSHLSQRLLTSSEIQKKRKALFIEEQKRQNAHITDIEKIDVEYIGLAEECTLIMNKNFSTPYNCAQHVSHSVCEKSVLAEVDGELWDMFRPLEKSCSLRFLHFRDADPYHSNKAFWRSLSIMLGSIIETGFKDSIPVHLCSFPRPNVRSGSFVYDVDLGIENWEPTKLEMQAFSAEMVKLSLANKPFYRLRADASLVLKIFEDNPYKSAQIPHIAALSEDGKSVVLYRVGDFVDISRGPLMSHTGHMGKCTITSVHRLESGLYRFQGIALPKDFQLNFFSYNILEQRASKLNYGRTPSLKDLGQEITEVTSEYQTTD